MSPDDATVMRMRTTLAMGVAATLLIASPLAAQDTAPHAAVAVAPSWDSAPPPPPKAPPLDDGATMVGVRGSVLHVDSTSWGLAFAGHTTEYMTHAPLSVRDRVFWILGGGSGGFEGALGVSLALGGRLDLERHHGPVARAGIDAYLLGNDLLYASMLELPVLQLGYQYLAGRTLVEAGAKGGAVLSGRYNDPEQDAIRKLGGSFEWGGYASVHLTPMRLDAQVSRIEARKTGSERPLDVIEGSACGLVSWFSACADVRFERGDVTPPGGAPPYEMRSAYVGMLLGFVSRRNESGLPCTPVCE